MADEGLIEILKNGDGDQVGDSVEIPPRNRDGSDELVIATDIVNGNPATVLLEGRQTAQQNWIALEAAFMTSKIATYPFCRFVRATIAASASPLPVVAIFARKAHD
jgi:hypothetical protein